eukprot:scaffold109260_cov60-Phaeocystis_antarctica.AAC.2
MHQQLWIVGRQLRQHGLPLCGLVPTSPVDGPRSRVVLLDLHLPHVGVLPPVQRGLLLEVRHQRRAPSLGHMQKPEHAALHRLRLVRHAAPGLARRLIVRCRLQRAINPRVVPVPPLYVTLRCRHEQRQHAEPRAAGPRAYSRSCEKEGEEARLATRFIPGTTGELGDERASSYPLATIRLRAIDADLHTKAR